MTATPLPITVRYVDRHGESGWEAVTLAAVPTTHVIGLRPTAEEVVEVLGRMGHGPDEIAVVR